MRGRRPLVALALLLVLTALTPSVAAQAPALRLEAETADIDVGREATVQIDFTVYEDSGVKWVLIPNIHPDAGHNWILSVSPASSVVTAGQSQVFTVTATADRIAAPRDLDITLEVVAVSDNKTVHLEATATTHAVASGLVLGRWENPLTGAFAGDAGTFILNVGAWLGIAFATYLVLNPGIKTLAKRSKTDLDDQFVRIITRPVFVVIFAYGLKQSLESFQFPTWFFSGLDIVWQVVLAFAVILVVYRLWSSIILTVGKRAAAKTESQLDDRLYPLFEKIGGVIILIAGAFYIVSALGFNTTFFAAGGAILSLVIAFAAQDTLGNFFSGIFLLLDQPFQEGDDIQIETGEVCRVEHIGLRSTKLLYKANHEHFIMPNNMLANARIVNLLRPDRFYKVNIPIGVAYGSDVAKVKATLLKVVDEHPLVLKDDDHKPWVWFMGFGDSSLDFKVFAWVGDVYTRFQVRSDLCEAIDHAFRQENIDIPFPQRTLWMGRESDVTVGPAPDMVQTMEEATGIGKDED